LTYDYKIGDRVRLSPRGVRLMRSSTQKNPDYWSTIEYLIHDQESSYVYILSDLQGYVAPSPFDNRDFNCHIDYLELIDVRIHGQQELKLDG